MSFQVTETFVNDYTSNLQMLLQQQGSALRPHVTVQPCSGENKKLVEQIGQVTAQERQGRHGDTPLASTPHDGRWLSPTDYEVPADLIDDVDQLRNIVDPTSGYAQAQAYAIGRAMDDAIINGHFSPAATGKTGAVLKNFGQGVVDGPNSVGNVVGTNVGGAGSGLNVAKLRAAKAALMKNQVDLRMETPRMVITADEHDQLLGEIQVVSQDYNSKPVLVDGMIERYMGIEFVHCERLVDDPSGVGSIRKLPVWVPSGMVLGVWMDIKVRITERPDKRYSFQVYTVATFAATRVEEGKCVEVLSTYA